MKIDIGKASYDGRWYEFGEARLKIRAYPMSRQDVAIKDGAIIISGDASADMFNYCLVEWEGVTGADNEPLKLTADVKKKVYDFKLGQVDDRSISEFVILTARKLQMEIETDTKN